MIPVPVISFVYRSTTADTLEMTRTCSQCRQISTAKVSVASVGEAETLLPLHDRSETARSRARAGLTPAAERVLALAACPHCGARERAVESKVRRAAISASALTSRALIPIVLAAFAFMLAALAIVIDHSYLDGVLIILVGIVFGAIAWLLARAGARKRIAHARYMADATVVWLGYEHAEPPPAIAVEARASNGWPFA